jgi:sporulation protein YlmC with PRC-barrel domain
MKKITLLTVLFFAFGLAFTTAVCAQQQQRDTSQQQRDMSQQQPGVSQQQPQQQQQPQRERQARDQIDTKGNLARADELKGMTVRNMQGEELGSVRDAIVNTQSGKIDYIVIQSGGIAGIGGRTVAVPASSFQVTKDRRLVVNITKDRLDKAPEFSENEWPPANEQKWTQTVRSYFGKQTGSPQARQPSESQPTPMGKQ